MEILEISSPAFRLLSRRKENKVFSISLYKLNKEIERREEETDLLNNDLKKRLPRKYYNFLNVFFKSNSDTLAPYYNYDYKIVLKKPEELSYGLLYL